MTFECPLPNFIHFGSPKSGSGTLSHVLTAHPRIFTPRPKEINFFNKPRDYQRGAEWFSERYFSNYSGEPVICDKSIGYSTGDPEATLGRIVDMLGTDIRILLTMRHPAERAYSHYCMARYKGQFENLGFADAIRSAIETERNLDRAELGSLHDQDYYGDAGKMAIFRNATYLTPGRYGWLLRLCREAVGSDKVMVLFTEDMAADLPGALRLLTEFLEIDAIEVDPGLRVNEATALRFPFVRRFYNHLYAMLPVRRFIHGISPEMRRTLRKRFLSWNYKRNENVPPADPEGLSLLQAYYADDMRHLQDLTGRDLSHWLTRYPYAENRS